MTIRFFILQAHYRSTLDFSNEALLASQKGLTRLMKAMELLDHIKAEGSTPGGVDQLSAKCEEALRDDLNTPLLIGHLFDGVKMINNISEGKGSIDKGGLEKLKSLYNTMVYQVLGLAPTGDTGNREESITGELVEMILQLRQKAKADRDFESADRIRDGLTSLGVILKDRKDGTDWEIN